MLIVSEVAEAMEGVRKDLMDDHLPHRKMVVVELADVLIRVFDYCGEHNLDIGGALMEKRNYNTARKDHSYAARSKPNGKKW
jgi:NTP pyrophosphatase (non-canonical NTP hydrolase)